MESKQQQSQLKEPHTMNLGRNSRIRVDNVPRIGSLERRFKCLLEELQNDFGPIDWSRTKNEERTGPCFVVFKDPSVHSNVIQERNRKTFEGFNLQWSLEWSNDSAFGSPTRQEVPPPRRAYISPRLNESSSSSSSLSPQSNNLRWLTPTRLEAMVNESVTSGFSEAFSACEARFSILAEQATSRALNRHQPRTEGTEESSALYPYRSFAAQARRAVCPVCQENIGRMATENVLYLSACGHYICRDCCELLRARTVRCPICRSQGLARRGYFLL